MCAAINSDKHAAWHDKVWEPENRRTIRFFRCCHWSHVDTTQNGNTEHVQDPYSVGGRKEQEWKKSSRPRASASMGLRNSAVPAQLGLKAVALAWLEVPQHTKATNHGLVLGPSFYLCYLSCSFSEVFDVPVYWPILVVYFFTLFARGEPELQKLSWVGKFLNRWRLEPLDC